MQDGVPGAKTIANQPIAITVDSKGQLYYSSQSQFSNNQVRYLGTDGIVRLFAGNGAEDLRGNGGPATAAGIFDIEGLAADGLGNVHIGDVFNHVVHKVDSKGVINLEAGSRVAAPGPALGVVLARPYPITTDLSGNVFWGDVDFRQIKRLSSNGGVDCCCGRWVPAPL